MRFLQKASAGLVVLWLCPVAEAGLQRSSSNHYQSIVERNVFHLVPEPPRAPPPPAPLPELTLTGITTILPDKRALLKIRYPTGPGVPAKEEACILKPGERQGPVEVLEIDEKAGAVKVNNSGTLMTLTFGPTGSEQRIGPAEGPVRHPPFRLAVH